MVRFSFHNKDGHLIHNHDASKDLSNEIDAIKIICSPFAVNDRHKVLTTMLKLSSSKFNKIILEGIWPADSPEFLASLVLFCNKAIKLEVSHCYELTYPATSCLMAALLQWNGIQELHIDCSLLTTAAVKLLFEGVASSPCLENLKLHINFYPEREAGTTLIHALRRNRSLKVLQIESTDFDELLPQLLRVAILETKVKSLSVEVLDQQPSSDLPIDVLQEVLCRSDCELEKLKLSGFDVIEEDARFEESIFQNTSVKEFALGDTHTHNLVTSKTINLFKSLEKLELAWNSIKSLPLSIPCLLDENSTIQSLQLKCNFIASVDMERFITQLLTAKHLKSLELDSNECENSDGMFEDALVDAISNDTSLELANSTSLELVNVQCRKCVDIFSLALNRGGRRVFEPQPSVSVNLWPALLARASKLKYYCHSDSWGNPTLDSPRTDVVFWLLNRMAPQLHEPKGSNTM